MSGPLYNWSFPSPTASQTSWKMETVPLDNQSSEQLHHASNTWETVFGAEPPKEEKFVHWTGPQDRDNPFNWTVSKKWRVTILACFMTFVVQINGTAMTSAAEQINETYHVSDEHFPHSYWPVLSWNLGGAIAPMLALPLMENFGVRRSYIVRHTNRSLYFCWKLIHF